MTPSGFQKVLIDLGWIALSRHALGLRPAEAHTLRHLTRAAGTVVTLRNLADAYSKDPVVGCSDDGVRKRVERVRTALADVGCDEVIRTLVGMKAYTIQHSDVARIEAAMVEACGYEMSMERAA